MLHLRLALLSTVCLLPYTAAPALAARAGVTAAVNQSALGTPPGGGVRTIVLGADVITDEKIDTSGQGLVQILLADGTTFTVGPNSSLTIDHFVYDPNVGTAQVTASLAKGVFRFIGARTSKTPNGVQLNTPVGTVGIRGAVADINLIPNGHDIRAEIDLLFGQEVTLSGPRGLLQRIYQAGYSIIIGSDGKIHLVKTPPGSTNLIQLALTGHHGTHGGAPHGPTNNDVAWSGVPPTNSNHPPSDNTPPPVFPLPPPANYAETTSTVVDDATDDTTRDAASDATPLAPPPDNPPPVTPPPVTPPPVNPPPVTPPPNNPPPNNPPPDDRPTGKFSGFVGGLASGTYTPPESCGTPFGPVLLTGTDTDLIDFSPSTNSIGGTITAEGEESGELTSLSAGFGDGATGGTSTFTGATGYQAAGGSGSVSAAFDDQESAPATGASGTTFKQGFAGASPCTCMFLQWGTWATNANVEGQSGPGEIDAVGTWVAAQDLTSPTDFDDYSATQTGMTATYTGKALGYIQQATVGEGTSIDPAFAAAGALDVEWDFDSRNGTVGVTNFTDVAGTNPASLSFTVPVSQGGTSGQFSGSNSNSVPEGEDFLDTSSSAIGAFANNGSDVAAGVIGDFTARQSDTSNPALITSASGVFLGTRTGIVPTPDDRYSGTFNGFSAGVASGQVETSMGGTNPYRPTLLQSSGNPSDTTMDFSPSTNSIGGSITDIGSFPMKSVTIGFGDGHGGTSNFDSNDDFGATGPSSSATAQLENRSEPGPGSGGSGTVVRGGITGFTPCTCAYLQWGSWATDVDAQGDFGTGHVTVTDGLWVTGNLSEHSGFDSFASSHSGMTATYDGQAVGNTVEDGVSTGTKTGDLHVTYDLGNRWGDADISIDGHSLGTGITGDSTGPLFHDSSGEGPLIVNGGFVSDGTDPAKGVIGNFNANDDNWSASGVFAGQRTSLGLTPPLSD